MLSHCSTPTTRDGRLWVCIPLRMPEQHSWLEQAHCYWDYEGKTYSCKERAVAYHHCHIHSLVSSTNCWGTWLGRGILVDGRLRYGYCFHHKQKGLHLYAAGGLETFEPRYPGWVQLEAECNSTTKLKTG